MTIAVQKFRFEVTVQRDANEAFPYDNPVDDLQKVWTALFTIVAQGSRDARVRVGNVDAVFHTDGLEEDHEAGDN